MIATIHLAADLTSFAIVLSLIFAGRVMRGPLGGLLIAVGLVLLVVSGFDSAIKLFGDEWSFYERLYHFAWVWVGIGAFLVMRAGFVQANSIRKERDRG